MDDLKKLLQSWVFQSKGSINHYNKMIHLGTQPVRVIHHMLHEMFRNSYPGFHKELLEQIEAGKVDNELNMIFSEEPIMMDRNTFRTPRINMETRKIELHETFLSYLWCITYSVYVIYIETIDYPKHNKINGDDYYRVNQKNIEDAKNVFNYARYLIADFETWDKNALPNPEIYLAEKRNYVEQTNLFYTEAVKFILCHEFTHLKMHAHQITGETPDSNFLIFEEEADNNAIDTLRKGIGMFKGIFAEGHKLAVEIGIVFGILSMFFFSATTTGKRHPNTEDRLINALERLEIEDDHVAWGIACIGLQFWDEQFGLSLKWSSQIISFKQQYYEIVAQIKSQ